MVSNRCDNGKLREARVWWLRPSEDFSKVASGNAVLAGSGKEHPVSRPWKFRFSAICWVATCSLTISGDSVAVVVAAKGKFCRSELCLKRDSWGVFVLPWQMRPSSRSKRQERRSCKVNAFRIQEINARWLNKDQISGLPQSATWL